MNDQSRERQDSEIQFTKTVKAGKRVYYFDVKKDRNGELYMSITESKRVKDATTETRPVFEKHKIFLYREDMKRFTSAFMAAAEYTEANSDMPIRHTDDQEHAYFVNEGQMPGEGAPYDYEEHPSGEYSAKPLSEFRFDIDF